MVVEDEGITAKDIEARLTRLGYDVPAVAHSGPEAIAKAARTRPDLVLMDIRLKGPMDGVEAAQRLRARYGIPVTYLTAYADDDTLARAQTTAPYGYLVKPFDERELHATIQMALYRHHQEQRRTEAERLLTSVNDALLQLTPSEERTLRLRFSIGKKMRRSATAVVKQLRTVQAPERRELARTLDKLRATGTPPRKVRRNNPRGANKRAAAR
jgi:CheY-like chemotaxis protein